jgi:hypothetical protein
MPQHSMCGRLDSVSAAGFGIALHDVGGRKKKASLLERRPWLGGYVRKEVDNALTFRKYANDAYDHG